MGAWLVPSEQQHHSPHLQPIYEAHRPNWNEHDGYAEEDENDLQHEFWSAAAHPTLKNAKHCAAYPNTFQDWLTRRERLLCNLPVCR